MSAGGVTVVLLRELRRQKEVVDKIAEMGVVCGI
jgi:hypothetical protein